MNGKRDALDSPNPSLIELDMDPQDRIMYIYSAYHRCAVMDSNNCLHLWGTNSYNPFIFHQFDPSHMIKRLAMSDHHGLALDDRG